MKFFFLILSQFSQNYFEVVMLTLLFLIVSSGAPERGCLPVVLRAGERGHCLFPSLRGLKLWCPSRRLKTAWHFISIRTGPQTDHRWVDFIQHSHKHLQRTPSWSFTHGNCKNHSLLSSVTHILLFFSSNEMLIFPLPLHSICSIIYPLTLCLTLLFFSFFLPCSCGFALSSEARLQAQLPGGGDGAAEFWFPAGWSRLPAGQWRHVERKQRCARGHHTGRSPSYILPLWSECLCFNKYKNKSRLYNIEKNNFSPFVYVLFISYAEKKL